MRRGDLTLLDWLGVAIAGALALFLGGLFPLVARTFAGMFAEFGGRLPALTQLAITRWFPLALALAPTALVGISVAPGQLARPLRRGLIVGALSLATVELALLGYSLYLPIFELAGAIRSD